MIPAHPFNVYIEYKVRGQRKSKYFKTLEEAMIAYLQAKVKKEVHRVCISVVVQDWTYEPQ